MAILLTGVAGFIGFHTAKSLLERGEQVIGVDNLSDYYDVNLKKQRLRLLKEYPGFDFAQLDISHSDFLDNVKDYDFDGIIHLAAQAGVRYSLVNPMAYGQANLIGHMHMLELARHNAGLMHFVYASSSSVYGSNSKLPFSVEDRVDQPMSLYAATKRSGELMSHSYAHLYGIPMTGLRFFTVYGPWGRPDMSAFLFTQAILNGEEFPVYNQGRMKRNFSYIDDVVSGILGCLDNPPVSGTNRIYNIGNDKTVELLDFIKCLEDKLQIKAKMRLEPIQPGDVPATLADISAARNDFGFDPKTDIDEGLANFVDWYKKYYHNKQAA